MSYELIETVEVGSGGAASIEFTSIPQDGTDLVLKLSARNTDSAPGVVLITLNNDSASNYAQVSLEGTSSSSTTAGFFRLRITDSGDTANTFGSGQAYISNYTSTTDKSISCDSVNESNSTTGVFQRLEAVSYSTSSAITSMELDIGGDNFAEHTTASLYKVTA